VRIANAIDLHCHFGPDTVGGTLDADLGFGVTALQAAREALAEGHAALVLKSHGFASPPLATAVMEAVPGLHVYGGICTDLPSGGLNVAAVEAALALGARIVWLPTLHSHQDVSNHNPARLSGPGLRVIDNAGQLVPEVQEIFSLARQRDAILATGHISAEEHYAVIRACAPSGKVLVTHAGEPIAGPRLSPTQCIELADLGATIELTAPTCQSVLGATGKSTAEMLALISAVGADRCVLSTDYGWSRTVPKPASGLADFLEALWREGVSEAALTTMVSGNPAKLLALDL
jgi:hypothetical protein